MKPKVIIKPSDSELSSTETSLLSSASNPSAAKLYLEQEIAKKKVSLRPDLQLYLLFLYSVFWFYPRGVYLLPYDSILMQPLILKCCCCIIIEFVEDGRQIAR